MAAKDKNQTSFRLTDEMMQAVGHWKVDHKESMQALIERGLKLAMQEKLPSGKQPTEEKKTSFPDLDLAYTVLSGAHKQLIIGLCKFFNSGHKQIIDWLTGNIILFMRVATPETFQQLIGAFPDAKARPLSSFTADDLTRDIEAARNALKRIEEAEKSASKPHAKRLG